MGLLDNLKTNGNSDQIVSTYEPTVPTDPEQVSFDNWKVNTPNSTLDKQFKLIQEVPKIATEGVGSGNDAADALFNANTTAFSRALSSKANRMMATNQSSRTLNTELQNVQRQQLQQSQNLNDLNDLYKIKRQNFAGQLQFASQMANYYQQLSALKLQALGSLIGGGMSIAGKMIGAK